MFERELTLYNFTLGHLRILAADIDESAMGVAPFEGANPPVWILGHLAVCTDFAGRSLGLEPACSPQWHTQFAPGTKPSDLKPPLPTKSELLDALLSGARRVSEAAPNASTEALSKPHGIDILQKTNLVTVGDALAHLMTTHQAFHVAQLSACRRKAGKPPIV